jgi:cell division protease FtsH
MTMTRSVTGSVARMHRTGSARSEPPTDRPSAPVPPRWRNWLLLVGAVLTLALFFLPIPTKGNVEQLSYSQLKSDISDGQVASVALGPDGSITGTLSNGTKFASSYPVNLQDPQFAQLLDQHNIQVTTQPSQTSISSVLLSLLPLLLVVALFLVDRPRRPTPTGWSGWNRSRPRKGIRFAAAQYDIR